MNTFSLNGLRTRKKGRRWSFCREELGLNRHSTEANITGQGKELNGGGSKTEKPVADKSFYPYSRAELSQGQILTEKHAKLKGGLSCRKQFPPQPPLFRGGWKRAEGISNTASDRPTKTRRKTIIPEESPEKYNRRK